MTNTTPLPAPASAYLASAHVTWALQNRGIAAALVMARAIAANERVQSATWSLDAAGWGDSETAYRAADEALDAAQAIARDAQRVASIHFR